MNKRLTLLVALFWFIFLVDLSEAKVIATFEGNFDVEHQLISSIFSFPSTDISSEEKQGSVTLQASKSAKNNYHLSVKIERLKTPFFHLSSQLESSFEFLSTENNDNRVVGKVWSQYSLLNYKPVQEISGEFEIKKYRFYLTRLFLGKINCQGSVDLIDPYNLDLLLKLSAINMDDFLAFWDKEKTYQAGGDVYGEIRALGTLEKLFLKGKFQSTYGFVDTLKFDNITLNIEGIYPHMQVTPSVVSETEGMNYAFDGPINLEDHANFEKQIRALNIDTTVVNSNSKLEWTIKSLKRSNSSATELKYIHKKGTETDTSGQQSSDMLGIERKVEF